MWLQRIDPTALGLIQVWEDYQFIAICDEVWTSFMPESDDCRNLRRTSSKIQNSSQMLLRGSPQLVRILCAYRAIYCLAIVIHAPFDVPLFRVRLLLDLSWDELRKAICPVHTIMGTDWDGLRQLLSSRLDPGPSSNFHCDSILWDLTSSTLRLLKQVIPGEVNP